VGSFPNLKIGAEVSATLPGAIKLVGLKFVGSVPNLKIGAEVSATFPGAIKLVGLKFVGSVPNLNGIGASWVGIICATLPFSANGFAATDGDPFC